MNRTGRGGAGNYKPAQKPAPEQHAVEEPDLELTRVQTSSSTHSTSSNKLERVVSREDPVVKVGRGGAGNYSTPEDLARTEFENVVKTNQVAPKTAETAPNFRGRGGAGNHKDAPDQAELERLKVAEKERLEEAARRERARVVEDVEAALAMPVRAHVHNRKGDLSR